MKDTEEPQPARRVDLERQRIERSVTALISEDSTQGNAALVRLNQVRLAALRFAYDGTLEQLGLLSAFDHDREQGPVNAREVARVVYRGDISAEGLKELFGVAEPTDSEADFFVSNVAADAWALQRGKKIEP